MNLAQVARNDVQAKFPGATVVERTRKSIKHQVAPGRFALWSHVSPIHIDGTETEIDTTWVLADPITDAPWLRKMVLADYNAYAGPGNLEFNAGQIIRYVDPASEEEITFEAQQLQWTNDLDQIEAVGDPQTVLPTIDDDALLWSGAYGPGLDFLWQTQSARLAKSLIINTLADIGSPSQTIIDGGNPVLRLQFIFQKSNNVSVWVDGVEWNEQANNPQITAKLVEFRDVADNVLWFFAPAYATDDSLDPDALSQVTTEYRFRRQGPNLFVEVRVPWSWLETAVYPVVIDPTVNPQVGASDEDAHEDHTDANFSSTATVVNCTANTSAAPNRRYFGAFVVQVNVPNAATVNQAYFTVVPNGVGADDPNVTLSCEDVDSAADFTATADVTNRVRTTATTSWVASSLGTSPVNSPDVDASVQEVLDRAGWSSGNIMGCFLDGNGDFNSTFQIVSYDGTTTDAPKLFIDYTVAGGSFPPRLQKHLFWNRRF